MRKKLFIGTAHDCEFQGSKNKCYVEISLEDDRFSACGEIWMQSKRDIISGGQNLDELLRLFPDNTTMQKIHALWSRWHLNDMRPSCEHQRDWDTSKQVEVVSYGLTSEAYQIRKNAIERTAKEVANLTEPTMNNLERALILLDDWYADKFTPPDADSPLSGCYEVKKREMKTVSWVKPSEHPKGLLCKPCPICGYKYGSAWIKEELPPEVKKELESFFPNDRDYDMYGKKITRE